MIVHHGYRDGSGEYFVTIDAASCDACGKCLAACPAGALEMTGIFLDLEDKKVAGVSAEHRAKLRYTCAACDHAGRAPCEQACVPKAVSVTWRQSPQA